MPGTRFERNTLIREVGQNFSRKIEKLREELAEEGRLTLSDRIVAWRERETARLREFTARVERGEVEDGELGRFEIKSMPYMDDWQAKSLRGQIAAVENAREKALAYIRALAAVEKNAEGGDILEVTAVDLKRIGYGV